MMPLPRSTTQKRSKYCVSHMPNKNGITSRSTRKGEDNKKPRRPALVNTTSSCCCHTCRCLAAQNSEKRGSFLPTREDLENSSEEFPTRECRGMAMPRELLAANTPGVHILQVAYTPGRMPRGSHLTKQGAPEQAASKQNEQVSARVVRTPLWGVSGCRLNVAIVFQS